MTLRPALNIIPDVVWLIALIYLIVVNLIALIMYGLDKSFAIHKKRRISEAALVFSAFIGGAYGALAGMIFFRHKTKHAKFLFFVPLFCVLWTALIILSLVFLK